jgi:hypothetical protein
VSAVVDWEYPSLFTTLREKLAHGLKRERRESKRKEITREREREGSPGTVCGDNIP